MSYEEETLYRLHGHIREGEESGRELEYDPDTRTIRPSSPGSDPDRSIKARPSDMDLGAGIIPDSGMIILSQELVQMATREETRSIEVHFSCWPGEDVYSSFGLQSSPVSVPGFIQIKDGPPALQVEQIGKSGDRVRVILERAENKPDQSLPGTHWTPRGGVLCDDQWQECQVQLIPLEADLFSRHRGLYETNAVADKRVAIFGLSSLGSPIVIELTKAGVMHFTLADDDRLEVANIVRHVAGLSHVGRYKTKCLSSLIKDKNPYANVRTLEQRATWDNIEVIREIISDSDLVICATDTRESKVILNRLCVEERKPLIMPGVSRRAYSGHILSIHPGQTLCYQCFLQQVPDVANDQEISDRVQADDLAYSDREVPIEPGLSLDIAPIAHMATKRAIQYLLKGKNTTLRNLDEDLVAPWLMWINRREAGTDLENLKPLAFGIDGIRVMRWYGIKIGRHPSCPVCSELTEKEN